MFLCRAGHWPLKESLLYHLEFPMGKLRQLGCGDAPLAVCMGAVEMVLEEERALTFTEGNYTDLNTVQCVTWFCTGVTLIPENGVQYS